MEHIVSIKKRDEWLIYGFGILICAGLFARDIMGVSVNKYIFLALAMVPIIFVKLDKVVPFSCFLIPLYVGLPGNLISVCLLIRLAYEVLRNKIIIDGVWFALSYVLVSYIIIQNIVHNHMAIYNMMAAFDFFLLCFLMSAVIQNNCVEHAILSFGIGVCVVGVIMLGAMLKYYSIEEMMSSATRLGDVDLRLLSGAGMNINIDPNFYGMNVIAAVSSCSVFLCNERDKINKIFVMFIMLIMVVISFMGLSRTFVVLIFAWAILWAISQKKFKRMFYIVFAIGIIVILLVNVFPVIVSGLLARFNESDVAGGNGRIGLILKYYEPWKESVLTILLGLGMFNCETHCAPLQYLFSLGIVGIVPLIGWFCMLFKYCRNTSARRSISKWVPLIVTFVSFSSLPAAGAINYTMPLVISGLVFALDQ